MHIKRLTGVAALVSMLLLATPSYAETHANASLLAGSSSSLLLNQSSAIANGSPLAIGVAPWGDIALPVPGNAPRLSLLAAPAPAAAPATAETAQDSDRPESVTDLRKALVALAMSLRDVRYVRGGHNPNTGFDCSGFVRYVFAHAIGLQLPTNSASQFLAGLKVKRSDLKPGDLVFFHTHGRRRGISHVGIYISDGRFIHAPTTGKSVQISSLDESYWAKHYVGAKRPDGMAALLARNG